MTISPVPPPASDPTEVAHTTAHLRTAHRQEASTLQHTLDRVAAVIGWPGFVVLLVVAIFILIAADMAAAWYGISAPDPPRSFAWLGSVTSTGALVMACLILTTQRREDKLADHRAQLMLELSIANDQKIAKIIGLLEEARRDNPAMADRVDHEAAAMATPSDTAAVLEAIKELSDDTM